MGTRVYAIPGGVPNFAGEQNFGDPGAGQILSQDVERWVDADNGNDSNPGTEALPWLSFAPLQSLVAPYVELRAVVTIHVVAATAQAEWKAVQLPRFRSPGKLVLSGDAPTTVVTFDADAGSDESQILSAAFPLPGSPVGYFMECVSGTLIGERRAVAAYVDTAGDYTLIPAAPFDGTPDGTWRLLIPSAGVYFDPSEWCSGATSEAFEATGSDPGVYLVNLQLSGVPVFTGLWLFVYSCEAYADGLTPYFGLSIDFGRMSCGLAFQDLPWVDPSAALWNGAGLVTRQAAAGEAGGNMGDLFFCGEQGVVLGYFVGTRALMFRGMLSWYGGQLFGHTGGASTLNVVNDAQFELANQSDVIPCYLSAGAAGRACLRASGPAVTGVLYFVDFTGAAVALGTLLLAEFGATISCSAELSEPVGSGGSYAQDVKGGGRIYWDHEPLITGSVADLRATGVTGANALLAVVTSKFGDAADVEWIARWA